MKMREFEDKDKEKNKDEDKDNEKTRTRTRRRTRTRTRRWDRFGECQIGEQVKACSNTTHQVFTYLIRTEIILQQNIELLVLKSGA